MTTATDDDPAPLDPPAAPPRRRGRDLVAGVQLIPERRIAAFSDEDFELLVRHWIHEGRSGRYARLLRLGATNDKGRDVIGRFADAPDSEWDNYQCKRYQKSLAPKDVRAEVGKLVYWVTEGAYTKPKKYFFVSPLGVSTQARALLEDPSKLRSDLRRHWNSDCADLCELTDISATLDAFEFPPFDVITAEDIVDELRGTAVFPVFFGGGLTKPRPPMPVPPADIAQHEIPYVSRLVEAYDEHSPSGIADASSALADPTYGQHLVDSRRSFYCAESLREFSKDVLTDPAEYDELRQQIHDGVRSTALRAYADGFDRVLAVASQAVQVQLDDHPLAGEVQPTDRVGMCHQLANDGQLRWKNPT